MMTPYEFEISGPLSPEFEEQVVSISALIPEAMSRHRIPGLWKLADRIQSHKKADPAVLEKRRRRRPFLGALNLLLALFALGPAVLEPEALWSLLILGSLCLGTGIGALRKQHRILLGIPLLLVGFFYGLAGAGGEYRRLLILGIFLSFLGFASLLPHSMRKQKHLEQLARSLYEGRAAAVPSPVRIRLTDSRIETDTDRMDPASVSYDSLWFILESQDLLLLCLSSKGLLLDKQELVEGSIGDLKADLAHRCIWLTAGS